MKNIVSWSVLIVCTCAMSASAQNRVVFDNQSGEPALVKLIGPTQTEVLVPNGAKAGSDAAAGRYVIKVRYGTPGRYRYSKGEEFEIRATATTRSETTITLHAVVAGNYDSQPISAEDFAKVDAVSKPRSQQSQENAVGVRPPGASSVARPPAVRTSNSNSATLKDPRDGRVYEIARIGDDWWMAENLGFVTEEQSWSYQDSAENDKIYGRLYTLEAAKKASPPGWHVASQAEWFALAKSLNITTQNRFGHAEWQLVGDGKMLLADGASGFDVLLAGFRQLSGVYDGLGSYATFWCVYGLPCVWRIDSDGKVYWSMKNREIALSVRCVKDKQNSASGAN